jgi:hypothetical protein
VINRRARPTWYRGHLMRSRLEARFAGHLDDMGQEWLHEPCAYADGLRAYLPDFLLPHVHSPLSDPGEGWGFQSLFFEVKGATPEPAELAVIQADMEAILATEPAAQLAIVTEAWMTEGRFLVREAPAPGTLRFGTWDWGTWGECRCATVSPVVLRPSGMTGRCPDCGSSVFVGYRRQWFPGAA